MPRILVWGFLVAFVVGVLLVFMVFGSVKALCHECLTLPAVAECDRRGGAVSVRVESERSHGYIVRRDFAGCRFYWHEARTGGN